MLLYVAIFAWQTTKGILASYTRFLAFWRSLGVRKFPFFSHGVTLTYRAYKV